MHLFHRWRKKHSAGVHVYEECETCHERRVIKIGLVHQAFMSAGSKGQFLHQRIKNSYSYQKAG